MIFDEPSKISHKAIALLEDNKNKIHLSSASLWEISIKYSIGKLELKKNPSEWLPNVIVQMDLATLPINQQHALTITKLPPHHKDPFDRMLISQAKSENMPILSPDHVFKIYEIPVVW